MRIEEAAAQNERQDRVVDEIVRGLGLAHDVKVGLVTRGDCWKWKSGFWTVKLSSLSSLKSMTSTTPGTGQARLLLL